MVALLQANHWLHGYCDPKLWPRLAPAFGPEFTVETAFDRTPRRRLPVRHHARGRRDRGNGHDHPVRYASTSCRLGALAPWVHIAVLRREEVMANLAQAVALLGDDPNIIWVTGPSKTADVEGILIEGVHGPGRQIALLMG